MWGNKRGQSALEYALLIAVVIAALVAMNLYMKKGVQGKLKESTDQVGRQFSPADYFETSWKTESQGQTVTNESRTDEGVTTSTTETGENITRSEYEAWGVNNTSVPGQKF